MIERQIQGDILKKLKMFPAVCLLGARQVGKTTMAKQLAKRSSRKSIYLDLENPRDVAKLSDAYTFLDLQKDKLVIVDEVQRMPELFAMLRSLIDEHRKPGRFLLLGSANPQLMKGVSETLAGRIFYAELYPFGLPEIRLPEKNMMKHWFRGGFPGSYLAKSQKESTAWLNSFVTTYVEKELNDIFGVSFPRQVIRHFWMMLAHSNASTWNAEVFARSLGITGPTVNKYLDYLEASFMIRRLPAWFYNAKKRIVKAPKVYLADTGILHALCGLNEPESIYGHPIIGASWEGYVIEQVYQQKSLDVDLYYYRTQNGAESDMVIVKNGKPLCCVEIKFSNSPAISQGFYNCIEDLGTKRNFVVTPGSDRYKKQSDIEVIGLYNFLKLLPNITK